MSKRKTALEKQVAQQMRQLAKAAETAQALTDFILSATEITDRPAVTAFSSIVARARTLSKESMWLMRMLMTKRSIYSNGFSLSPLKKDGTPDDQGKFDEWLYSDAPALNEEVLASDNITKVSVESKGTNFDRILKFADDLWWELLLLDVAVVAWWDNQPQPVVIPVERTEFSDTLGIEILAYDHGLSSAQINNLPQDRQQRFRDKSRIFFDPKEGEHFRVEKLAAVGSGYGTPGIYSAFRGIAETQAKEIAFNRLAQAMRLVTRHHKLGHEIKQGAHAGKSYWFWNAKRDAEVKRKFANKEGLWDFTSNFDHEIEFPAGWPDLKLFEETAWKGSNARLNEWAGPIQDFRLATGEKPFLASLVKSDAQGIRRKVAACIAWVIQRSMSPPCERLEVSFSNNIFNESRLQAEMERFAFQNGALSSGTLAECAGHNSAKEKSRKVAEAADPEAQQKLYPLWDQAHGTSPAVEGVQTAAAPGAGEGATKKKGADGSKTPGRTPGTPNK